MSARQPLALDLDDVNEALDHYRAEVHAQGWAAASQRNPETEISDEEDRRRAAVIAAIKRLAAADKTPVSA